LFGDAAPHLARAIDGRVPTTVSPNLREALPRALAAAAPGDAVLWSPAFASFDQYPNFRARALEFHALLAQVRADEASAS
jgi:UDP-N-acetylmuramoylalanine--D-glutamate ligase